MPEPGTAVQIAEVTETSRLVPPSPDISQPKTLVQIQEQAQRIETSWSGDPRYSGVFAAEQTSLRTLREAEQNGTITPEESDKIKANRLAELILAAQDDELTDLRSTVGFENIMSLGINFDRREGNPTSMMFIDLDGFKEANDTIGHDNADQVLIAAGGLIQSTLVRSSDVGARFHGDEFGVGLPSSDINKAVQVALALKRDMPLAADEVVTEMGSKLAKPVTMSIGIVQMSHPKERDSRTSRQVLSELVAQADEAMYVAKSIGRDKAVARVENPDGTVSFIDVETGEVHTPPRDSKGKIIKDKK